MPSPPDAAVGEAAFVVVARLAQLPDGRCAPITIDGHHLVLARRGGVVYACQSTCPHEMAGLVQARIEGDRLVCPRHLASFDLTNGRASSGWTLDALKLYPVRVENGAVAVDAAAVRRNPPGGPRTMWDFTRR
jgi:3-phenylpropionate/trans-cinnamate dioxygenase ferredoxin component